MTEAAVEIPAEGFELFDPENFVTTTALNGRRGVVTDAEFMTGKIYGDKYPEANALKVTVTSKDLEKPRVMLVGSGALKPSQDGKTPSLTGPFVVGQIEKTSNLADFIKFLKASGFPFDNLKKRGADSLIGAEFTFRAFEKKVNKEMKAYDMPAEFHGFVEVSSELATQAVVVPVANPASEQELKDKLTAALLAALLKQPTKEIPRGQLSIRVSGELEGYGRKIEALGLLTRDDYLVTIPGVLYDKKTVKLVEVSTPEATPATA